jgi:hypothetical protein
LGKIKVYLKLTLLDFFYLAGLEKKASFSVTIEDIIEEGHGLLNL